MPDQCRVAVCDTSPLQYLHQLGMVEVLSEIYGAVLVPAAVRDELAAGRAIGVSLPDLQVHPWIAVRTADAQALPALPVPLGRGEREALALALRTPQAVLLADDRQARRCAEFLGLRLSATLGVLLRAKHSGLIAQLGPVLDVLDGLGFRLGQATRRKVLALGGEDL
jgi:predicted nucleic acid-binding protein